MKKLLKFALAGTIGFSVDALTLLALLHFTPVGPYIGRVIAIGVAMLATWIFNRTFTFERSRHSLAVESFRYGSVGITAALLNYCLYTALLISLPGLRPLVAMTLSSLAAMAFSFFGYSRFVFRR